MSESHTCRVVAMWLAWYGWIAATVQATYADVCGENNCSQAIVHKTADGDQTPPLFTFFAGTAVG